ncbi:hypothetical protein L3X38_019751 [Prunus dulcis]|uniref:Uncharacterized protein n=1 Tax=Prunus dulcis TaxID=3755 RepID=A0AAD4ZBC8_PRUDU|nr:hypothetical protein L3X38_019751 [Prunus dulcis]
MPHHRNRREELILAVHYPVLNLIDAMETIVTDRVQLPILWARRPHQQLIYVVLASQLMITFIAIYFNYVIPHGGATPSAEDDLSKPQQKCDRFAPVSVLIELVGTPAAQVHDCPQRLL